MGRWDCRNPAGGFWHSSFISSSLLLIGLHVVTPDMCVAAFVCLASALVVKVRKGSVTYGTFVALGVVLGLAYLTKTVMFPLGFVFLVTAMFAGRKVGSSMRHAAAAILTFVIITGPFIAAISQAKGRGTFGDSGKINYQIEVQRDDWFVPKGSGVRHPVKRLLESPVSYEFSGPVAGTYPLWYDPSYWHEGVGTGFDLTKEAATLHRSFKRYWFICTNSFVQLNITIVLLLMWTLAPSFRLFLRLAKLWPLSLPALCALLLYALVVVESRYVAPFLLMVWVVAFSGIRSPSTDKFRDLLAATLAGLALTVVILSLLWIYIYRQSNIAVYPAALTSMQSLGLTAGDKLAVLGNAPQAGSGAFIARLGRMQIVAETLDEDAYWAADASTRARLADDFAKAGAKAILAYKPPRAEKDWAKLGDSDYYLFQLPGSF